METDENWARPLFSPVQQLEALIDHFARAMNIDVKWIWKCELQIMSIQFHRKTWSDFRRWRVGIQFIMIYDATTIENTDIRKDMYTEYGQDVSRAKKRMGVEVKKWSKEIQYFTRILTLEIAERSDGCSVETR